MVAFFSGVYLFLFGGEQIAQIFDHSRGSRAPAPAHTITTRREVDARTR